MIEGDLTVMQAIAMAGGATDKGAPNRVRIFRTVDGKQQEVKGVKLSDLVKAGRHDRRPPALLLIAGDSAARRRRERLWRDRADAGHAGVRLPSRRRRQEFVVSFGGRFEQELQAAGAAVHRVPPPRASRPLMVWRARRAFMAIQDKVAPDVTIFHSAWPHAMFAAAARAGGARVGFWQHQPITAARLAGPLGAAGAAGLHGVQQPVHAGPARVSVGAGPGHPLRGRRSSGDRRRFPPRAPSLWRRG